MSINLRWMGSQLSGSLMEFSGISGSKESHRKEERVKDKTNRPTC